MVGEEHVVCKRFLTFNSFKAIKSLIVGNVEGESEKGRKLVATFRVDPSESRTVFSFLRRIKEHDLIREGRGGTRHPLHYRKKSTGSETYCQSFTVLHPSEKYPNNLHNLGPPFYPLISS